MNYHKLSNSLKFSAMIAEEMGGRINNVDLLRTAAEAILVLLARAEQAEAKADKAERVLTEKEAVWEEYQNRWGEINFRCSHCKKYRFHNGAMIREYKYCPGCGAKMRGEEKI